MTGGLPNRSVRRPVIGERPNIPNVCAERTKPDRRQPVAVVDEVQRRHRHDQDHHDLGGDERDERGQRPMGARGSARQRRDQAVTRRSRVGRADGSASAYGSGRSRRTAATTARPMKITVRPYAPASSGQAERDAAMLPAGAARFGPMHRPDRRAPDDQADRRGTSFGRGHVGRDVSARGCRPRWRIR